MSSRIHVFCIPPPQAGHSINIFNVASVLANPTTVVHCLVLNLNENKKWMKATGQDSNPNVHLEALDGSKWESWKPDEPRQIMTIIQTPEFSQAVEDKMEEVKQNFQHDTLAAVVFNGAMTAVIDIADKYNLRKYLLMPLPFYAGRLGAAGGEGSSYSDKFRMKGIGGLEQDMEAELGNVPDMQGKMMRMFISGLSAADGLIYSNTNTGLEGEDFEQDHMPRSWPKSQDFLIGPILPPWYETALDNPSRKPRAVVSDDQCITFLDKQAEKSVVYIALGSAAQLSVDQAKTIVDKLRKNKVRWILLFRQGTEQMRQVLGGDSIDDGLVTPWAPQQDVLLHPALKCVLSHGGFGTMIEGIFAGQPFITSPVMSDQFIDTRVMLHLGIGLGCIAENRYVSVMDRKELTPFWPEDGPARIEQLFDRVFGSQSGEKELEVARAASRRMRQRLIETKATAGVVALEALRKDMTRTSSENSAAPC